MRDTSVYNVCKLVLYLVLIVQNVVCHVYDLKQLDLFVLRIILFNPHLKILDLLALAFVEFEHKPLRNFGVNVNNVFNAHL